MMLMIILSVGKPTEKTGHGKDGQDVACACVAIHTMYVRLYQLQYA